MMSSRRHPELLTPSTPCRCEPRASPPVLGETVWSHFSLPLPEKGHVIVLLCPDRLTPAYKVLIFTGEAGTLLGPLRKSDEYSGSHIRILTSRGLCLQISIRPAAKNGHLDMEHVSPLPSVTRGPRLRHMHNTVCPHHRLECDSG